MSELPTNIQEFNKICALVFARLYQTFPQLVDIDRTAIAGALRIADASALDPTLTWLARNDYIKITDLNNPWRRITLADKGLAAMSLIPSGLKQTVGTTIVNAVEGAPSPGLSGIGDLVGGFMGGLIKSLSSG
jgi:hypothetical protein